MSHSRTIAAFCASAVVSAYAPAQSIPRERPRARPPSELTGWAEWERAAEIFARVKVPPAPPLTPDEAMKSFRVAPGFRLELVAAEPMVVHPIFFEFDPDGRIWAIEYSGYMRDLEGSGEADPVCRVVVLDDTNEDGRADKSTVFLDGLVMPRTLAFVEGGVLVAEPPRLWYCRDTDGDLRCDSKVQVGTYGRAGNPQHTANGLAYGIDNWLHSADWERKHRFRNGQLIEEPAVYRGQFGVSFDETGRYVTCRESSPVEMDLIPEEYIRRNPALLKSLQRGRDRSRFGIAVPIGRQANECFPIRPTPGITLGALELRDDGTLRTYTIVAGTGVYLGDQLPADAYGNIFVPEAGGHLIGRLRVSGGIQPRAQRYYPDGQELLASTDERFRPMSIRTGPDGALYFADMYKGIIEHIIFMAPYIADQIRQRNLAAGNNLGRIYRLVSTEKPVSRKRPQLNAAASATLVEHLDHPNGWWRITAQRLLVERRDQTVIPLLRSLASSADASSPKPTTTPRARLHALWTLEGLGAMEWEGTFTATADPDDNVRAAAIRLCERLLTSSSEDIQPTRRAQFLARLQETESDASPIVRLQTALSLGSASSSEADSSLARLIAGSDSALFRTAALSSLHDREGRFLNQLLTDPAWREHTEQRRSFLMDLGETIFDAGDASRIEHLLAAADSQTGAVAWHGAALLDGILAAAPGDLSNAKPVALEREPEVIRTLLKSSDRAARDQGWRLIELFTWPGSDRAHSAGEGVKPLGPEHQKLSAKGRELYAQLCGPCHQPHGSGLANVAPPLNRSEWVAGPPERLVRVVLHGLFGPLEAAGTQWNHHMPGFRDAGLTNAQNVAAVLTYVRRAWDNAAEPVDPAFVEPIRAATADRQLPWTAAELLGVVPGLGDRIGEPPLIRPKSNGELLLVARQAVCYGERLAYRPALDIIAPWRKENDVATWRVEVPGEAVYAVYITLAADQDSTGDRFVIESETGRLGGTVPATGGYDQFREIRVGELKLLDGIRRILVRPDGKLRAELADVKGLRLVPEK